MLMSKNPLAHTQSSKKLGGGKKGEEANLLAFLHQAV